MHELSNTIASVLRTVFTDPKYNDLYNMPTVVTSMKIGFLKLCTVHIDQKWERNKLGNHVFFHKCTYSTYYTVGIRKKYTFHSTLIYCLKYCIWQDKKWSPLTIKKHITVHTIVCKYVSELVNYLGCNIVKVVKFKLQNNNLSTIQYILTLALRCFAKRCFAKRCFA